MMERRIRGNVYVRCGSGEKQEITSNAYLSTSTDQPEALLYFCELLKAEGYHIILFTWHDLPWLKKQLAPDILQRVDIIFTGPYDPAQRSYDFSLDDGLHNAVGSDNQELCCLWKGQELVLKVATIAELKLDLANQLQILMKDGSVYA